MSGFFKGGFVALVFAVVFLVSGQRTFAQCAVTYSGTNPFIVPAGVTSITVEAWGGGGKGGNRTSNGAAGGGGGGAYSRSVIAVTPGESYSFVTGAGSTTTAAGGTSRFYLTSSPGTDLVRAVGGNSVANNTATGATGGLASAGVGDVMYSGGNGANSGTNGGGGGSSGGTGANGSNATGTNGATAPTGGGNGAAGNNGTFGGDGGDGNAPGGGSGGSKRTNFSGNTAGGDGGSGRVTITYTAPANTVTAASSSPVVCVNSAITAITHNTTGATGISGTSASQGLPAGVTAVWSNTGGGRITISGTPTVAGTFNYSIPMTGGCTTGQLPATGTITVEASAVGAVSANQAYCVSGLPSDITIASANGPIQWQSADNLAFTTNVTPIGTDSQTLTSAEIGTLTATKYFRAMVTYGSCAPAISGIVTVTVSEPSAVGAVSADQIICGGDSPANMTIASATGTIQWQRADDAGFSTNVANVGTNSTTLTSAQVGPLTATRYFRAVVTSVGCAPEISGTITVTVNPLPTASAGPTPSAICQGQTSAAMGGSIGGGATGGTWSGGAGSWTNANDPASATYTAGVAESGSITLTLTTSGGSCGTITRTKTITVNQNPTASPGPALPAICQGQQSLAMNGVVGGGATGGTWSGGAGTWTNATNRATARYTAGASESGVITLTLTTTGGACGNTTVTKTITVNPNPTASAGPTLTAICQGQTSAAMGGSIGGGATGGTWSGGAGSWTNANDPASATYTAGAAEFGSITLTLTTSGGSCGTITRTKTITVNRNPTASAGTVLAAICQNQQSAAMGGSVGGGATGGTWSGGTGTWTNATNPSTARYTAGSSESGVVTLTLTTTGGACGTTTATKTITVNPVPTASAGLGISAICQGQTSEAMGGSIGGGATGGTWSGGAGSWTNANDPAAATYTAGAAESGSITLTLTTSGGSCGTTTATKTITVNQNPTASAGTVLAAICQGQTSAAMGGSVGGGATGGTWSGGSGTWTNATNPSTATYTAGASESGVITLTLTTSGGSCGSITVTKEISVNINPTATAGTTLSAICQGQTSAAMGGSIGGGATGGTWSGGAGSWSNANDPSAATYTAGASEFGPITLTLTTSGGLCGTITATKTITVNQLPVANPGPALAPICQGQLSAPMGGSVLGGAFGGIWSGGAGTWTNANNPSLATYQASATESGVVTLTLTTFGGPCGTTSVNKTVTVNPTPTATAGTTIGAICQGETSAEMGGSVGGGATGGTWSGGAGTWNNANDPALATYTADANESGVIILTLTTVGGDCLATIATKAITVNPIPTLDSPVTEVRCNNVTATYTATSTVSGTAFSWTRAAVAGISNPAGSGSTADATETLINTTTDPIDVTYVYTLTANGCTNTQNVTVTVNSATVIVTDPDPADYNTCFGDDFSPISVSATGTNLSYQWYTNTVADTTSGTAIPGETSPTFSPFSTPEGIQYYYVKVSGACGTLVSMPSGMYEVKPPVTVFLDNLETATDTQTICFGESFTELSVLADGAGPVTYQWYVSTTAGGNGTLIPGATDPTYTPLAPATPPTTAYIRYYNVVAKSNCGTVRSVKSGAFRVNPTPIINDMTNVVCSDGTFTSTPANTTNGVVPAGTTYSWIAPTLDAGLSGGAAGSGTSITGSLSNSTSGPLTAIYTVTPVIGTCTGDEFTVTVTVNPSPAIPDDEATICSGEAFTVSPVDGDPGTIVPAGTTYTWTRVDNTDVTGDGNQLTPQTTISQTLTNRTNVTQTVVYTVTPRSGTAGSCLGTPFTVTVTVNPKPVVFTQNTSACSGSPFTVSPTNGLPTTTTIVPAGTTYTWTVVDNPNVTGEADEATPQANISQVLTNSTTVNQTVVYSVTATSGEAGNCVGTSFTLNVTVNPTPVILDRTETACSGSPFTVSPVNGSPTSETIVPAGTKYTWTVVDNPNVTGDVAQGTPQTNISQTLTNTSGVAQTVIYTVTPTSGAAGACEGPTFTVTVTVNPRPTVLATPVSQAVCNNIAEGTLITIANPNNVAGTTFSWTRNNTSNLTGTGPGTAASGTGSTIVGSFTNNTTSTQTTTYTITATSPDGCSSTTTATVSVYATLVAPVISSTQAVCLFETPNLLSGTAATGGSNAYTYQWQRSTSFTDWSSPTNVGTGLTYQPPTVAVNTPTYYYRLVATDQCGTQISNVITIDSITSLGTIGTTTLSNLPASTAFCPGETFSNSGSRIRVTTENHSSLLTFRYILNYDPNFITPATTGQILGDTDCNGWFCLTSTTTATLPQFTVTNNTNATVIKTIEVIPYAYFFGQERCNVASVSFPVTIRPTPVLTATPASSTICSGGSTAIDLSTNITDNTPTTYSWTASVESGSASVPPSGSATVTGPYTLSQAISNTGVVNAVVKYTITPTIYGCTSGAAKEVFVTITPSNQITLTSAAATTNQTVCNDTPITQITYATTGATGATVSFSPTLPTGITGGWLNDVVTISGTPNVPAGGVFTYTVTTEGGCATAQTSVTGTITVSPVHTITAASDQTVCRNVAITNITMTLGGGATGATVTGLPSGVTSSLSGTTLTISGTPTVSGPFTYTVTTTGNGCATATTTGTITVTPTNTIAPGTNQTVCIDTPISTINLVTTGATGATIAGLPAGVTGSWSGNLVTISGTPTESGIFPYTVTLTGGCGTISTTGIIAVTGASSITLRSAPETTAQTVCRNTAITQITYETTGAVAANFSGLPAGVTGSWVNNVVTISGTPTVSGTFPYTVTTLGGCASSTTTGTINVTPTNTLAVPTTQTVCIDSALTPINLATNGATDATVTGLPAGVTGTWAANNVTISGTPTESGTFLYTVTTIGGCGPVTRTGTIVVTPADTLSLTSAPETTTQTVCMNAAIDQITYETTGATGATVTGLPAGVTGTWLGNEVTISGTPTVSGPFTYTVTTTGGCTPISATGTITVTPNNTVSTVTPPDPVCIGDPLPSITHITSGITGIVPESATVDYNLPNGVTADWVATTGDGGIVTIEGIPTETGVFNYNIPLTGGGCGPLNAVGTITVANPSYPITAIDVVNPATLPGLSTFTVYSAELTPGSYTLVYSTSGVNQGPEQTISAVVTTAGEITFDSQVYSTEGTTLMTILSIQKDTDPCPYFPPNNNTALYGVGCSEQFSAADGNDTFYVPANVSEVTIQAFGDVSSTPVTNTMAVLPSGVIYVVFDGTDVFATEVPASATMAERKAGAIVSTTGPNGRIVFNFDCNPLQNCATILDNGSQFTDSEGFTVLRFDLAGSCVWQAPDGLTEFEVLVVGGGGGGGFGSAAGGGGGGDVVYMQYMDISTGGVPGLQGATFNITVGGAGPGGTVGSRGGNGTSSAFGGPAFDYLAGATFAPLSAAGGGGGGSTNINPLIRRGADGASGGGGAASGIDEDAGGVRSTGSDGGNGNGQSFGASGAGGGGFTSSGGHGSDDGGSTMTGGAGGSGIALTISGSSIIYGAGGGGTSTGALTNHAGTGGSPYTTSNGSYFAGGSGTNNGVGQPATTYGSGGGAGGLGGSPGFPGVVYIRYPNYRILPVEYLYFNAKYNPSFRSGDLTWATAKEWENDRFEIERSVNTVKDWETIGQVNGAGYSDQPVNYVYQDMKLPLSGGNIFYRLKQRSFNGDSTYSDTKSIRVEALPGTSYWRVYPNPTTGNPINLELLDSGIYHDEPVTVRIIAATGQYDLVESKAGGSLNALVSESLRGKAAGVYTLEISWGIFREYHKVILRR